MYHSSSILTLVTYLTLGTYLTLFINVDLKGSVDSGWIRAITRVTDGGGHKGPASPVPTAHDALHSRDPKGLCS